MTDMKNAVQVLKHDDLGRVRMPRERREALLDEFEQSGLSGMKFARLVGIKYPTFAAWAQRRRQECKQLPASKPATAKMQWLEAVVEQKKLPVGSTSSVLLVRLPGGAQMEIADAKQAALAAVLLRALENKPALSC